MLLFSFSLEAQETSNSYISISPNGNMIAVGNNSTLYIYDSDTFQILNSFTNLQRQVTEVAWSPDSLILALGNGSNVEIWQNSWNPTSAQLVSNLQTTSFIRSLEWSPNGSFIAIANMSLEVWDTSTKQRLYLRSEHSLILTDVTWNPFSTQLATASLDNTVKIWNTSNGTVLITMTLVTNSSAMPISELYQSALSLMWNPDGTQLAVGSSDGTLRLWDTTDFNDAEISTFWGDPNVISISEEAIWSISWNFEGTQIAVGTLSGSLKIFDIGDYRITEEFLLEARLVSVGWNPSDNNLMYIDNTIGIHTIPILQPVVCEILVMTSNNSDLLNAITTGNNAGSPYTICLEDSTYTFTSSDNSGGYGANALPVITGDITIIGNGSVIERDVTASDFRLFRIENGGSLTLDSLTIQNGVTSGTGASGDGGAIHNRGTLNLVDTILINNTANVEGGAIYNDTNAVISITDSIISNNTAIADDGGAIDNHGSLVISGSTLEYNSSTNDDGGAIWNDSNATLSITDSIFRYNTANDFGGAIRNFGTLAINNSNIDNNTANKDGGAISSDAGVITITNGSLNNNTAVNDDGGAIITFAPLSLNNVILNGNSSGDKGGAIYAFGTDLIIENQSVFSNNVAGHNGGAIYTGSNSSTLTITDSTFSSNTTPQHGGALYLDNGTHTISNTLFQANTSVKRGGAIFTYGNLTVNLNTIFDGNQASDDGGAIYANDTITITDSTFRFNTAVDQGGAVRGFVSASSFLVNSCIHDNVAGNTSGLFFASSNFDATYNWWGATDGAGGSGSGSGDAVNNNVNYANFITTTCADAFGANGMGSQSLALAPNSVASNNADDPNTYPVMRSPYVNSFDVDDAWVNTARWQRDDVAGRTGGAWIIDTSVRGQASTLEMTTWVDLANSPQIRLDYADQAQLSNADLITLEIQTQGSSDWTVLNQSIGGAYSWQDRSISLSDYRGQTVRLRWRVEVSTDVPVGETSTFYSIDDLVITRR